MVGAFPLMVSFMVSIFRLTSFISSSLRLGIWTLSLYWKIRLVSRNRSGVNLPSSSYCPWSPSQLPSGGTGGPCCPISWLLGSPLRLLSSCMIFWFCFISSCMLAVKPWTRYSRTTTWGFLRCSPSEMEVSCPSTPVQGSCWATINLVSTM